jgi:hypothetical protein
MEMKLHLAETGARELRETVEVVRSILFAGEEPTVSRWSAVAISELTERWIVMDPRVDARTTDAVGSTAVQWLVVIA